MNISSQDFCSSASMHQSRVQCFDKRHLNLVYRRLRDFCSPGPNSWIQTSDLPVTSLLKSTLQPLCYSCVPRRRTYTDAECLCAPVCEKTLGPFSTSQVFLLYLHLAGFLPRGRCARSEPEQEKERKEGEEGSIKSMQDRLH